MGGGGEGGGEEGGGEEECDINCLSLHPKGHVAAAALDDGSVRLIDLLRVRERCSQLSASTAPATASTAVAAGGGKANSISDTFSTTACYLELLSCARLE